MSKDFSNINAITQGTAVTRPLWTPVGSPSEFSNVLLAWNPSNLGVGKSWRSGS